MLLLVAEMSGRIMRVGFCHINGNLLVCVCVCVCICVNHIENLIFGQGIKWKSGFKIFLHKYAKRFCCHEVVLLKFSTLNSGVKFFRIKLKENSCLCHLRQTRFAFKNYEKRKSCGKRNLYKNIKIH